DLAAASLALARRFADGATMWCIAPSWPQHARHVAVEFVHPVIVGKRALPAVAVTGPQPVGELRSVVRAGDMLCAISTVDEVVAGIAAGDAMVRTARGLESVDVTLVGPVHTGDLLLVHAGAAIALLDTEPGHD